MSEHICTHCKKPIVLVPSANKRAKKYGESPEYYRRLFTMHSDCQLELRDSKQQTKRGL